MRFTMFSTFFFVMFTSNKNEPKFDTNVRIIKYGVKDANTDSFAINCLRFCYMICIARKLEYSFVRYVPLISLVRKMYF